MAVVSSPRTERNQVAHQRKGRLRLALLLLPGFGWLLLFFLLPLVTIVVYSLQQRSTTGGIAWTWSLGNYTRLFGDTLYLQLFWRSTWLAVITTALTLLIGLPLALFIARRTPRWRALLVFAIMIPFWTNFLVRIYAWRFLLNNTGLINSILQDLGLPTLGLVNTQGAVLLGLVYGELPYMVLPLYAVLERFDWTLLDAANDLYANRLQTFRRVLLPLAMPGITAGSILVFVPTIGSFVVPQLLGGSKVAMLGNVLERQFLGAQDQPFGSAIAVVFMLLLTLVIMLYFRVTGEERV